MVVGGRRRRPGAPRVGHDRGRRDRRGRPRADARRRRRPRRGDPTGDHLPRHPGGRRRATSSPPRPGSAAGRSAGCRPRSGSSGTSPRSPPRPAGTSSTWEWLALPPDRGRGRAARARRGRRRIRALVDGRRRCRSTGCRRRRRWATVVGGLTAAAADALGLRPGIAGRRRARSTRSRATSAPGCSSRATPTTRADRPAGSASTGTGRSRSPGAFVTPAPLAGRLQRRRGDGRHRPGARLVPRRDPRRDDHHRRAAGGGRDARRPAPTAWSSCRTSPASARRSGTPTRAASWPA